MIMLFYIFIFRVIVFFVLGKFGQHGNLCKTEMITEPQQYYDLLTSDEFEVSNARIVSALYMTSVLL